MDMTLTGPCEAVLRDSNGEVASDHLPVQADHTVGPFTVKRSAEINRITLTGFDFVLDGPFPGGPRHYAEGDALGPLTFTLWPLIFTFSNG